MTHSHLVIIGFMGTGKSSIARMAANSFHWDLVQTDQKIEEKEKMGIAELFKSKGEPYFRDQESAVIKSFNLKKSTVIDTGGGIVLRPENAKLLKSLGIVLWFKARPAVIVKRVGDGVSRPLFSASGPLDAQVKKLLAEREPLYKSIADYAIDTSDLSENAVLDLIKLIGWKDRLLG